MSLRHAPLMYVFYETASLERQRAFCEHILGLRVIENEGYPPHEFHGLVKYDAGPIILSLNLTKDIRFRKDASDGLVAVLAVADEEALLAQLRQHGFATPSVPGGIFTDTYGHHYIFQSDAPLAAWPAGRRGPTVREVRLTVRDLPTSIAFYGDILDLRLLDQTERTARFATGTADVVLEQSLVAPDGRAVRYDTYLPVFHTPDILASREALVRRGLVFKGTRVGYSDIGATARFTDPSGHILCLYEPSTEALTWGSGAKVMELARAWAAHKYVH